MNKMDIYCITNKRVGFLENFSYKLSWVGDQNVPNNYLRCDNKKNIFFKEKYYSELTFQYWYWKNLMNLEKNEWVGFCQKRRFWIKPNVEIKNINESNIKKHLIIEPLNAWKEYDSIICKPIKISGAKKIKILKRGWKNLLKDPMILFDESRENIALHFDMHHGYGNLDLAIEEIDEEDKEEFKNFVYEKNYFNPHIMFISKTDIADKWFSTLFPWLERCENKFGFNKLEGYDTKRLYAYLAERYMSFWFKKYTKYLESPWVFIDS
tara:strand:- start:918 stop:1715 length:798 start_codon:yes stop_codon:yes gene_type:complete